jgi:hypothetical protein
MVYLSSLAASGNKSYAGISDLFQLRLRPITFKVWLSYSAAPRLPFGSSCALCSRNLVLTHT